LPGSLTRSRADGFHGDDLEKRRNSAFFHERRSQDERFRSRKSAGDRGQVLPLLTALPANYHNRFKGKLGRSCVCFAAIMHRFQPQPRSRQGKKPGKALTNHKSAARGAA
jgi:hypothetical protein